MEALQAVKRLKAFEGSETNRVTRRAGRLARTVTATGRVRCWKAAVAFATGVFQRRRSAECGESAVKRCLWITTFRFEDYLLGGPYETNHHSLFAGEEAILGF